MDVRESICSVIGLIDQVSVDPTAVRAFSNRIRAEDLQLCDLAGGSPDPFSSAKDHVAFYLIYAAICFGTWGEPKWGLTIDGKKRGGSASLAHALRSALLNRSPLGDPQYLAEMPEAVFRTITSCPDTEIPLLTERLDFLRIVGQTVRDRFNGNWMAVVEEGNFDASKISHLLVEQFGPAFTDTAQYRGHQIFFNKRAQLFASSLIEAYEQDVTDFSIRGEKELTALADYRVPQALHQLGILRYQPMLTQKLRDLEELIPGCEEEVAIRAATIWAIDQIHAQVQDRFDFSSPIRVDRALWHRSQSLPPASLPHHRTRTTAY